MEFLASLVTSSLWTKLFVSGILLSYSLQLQQSVGDRSIRLISLVALLLIIRDLAIAFTSLDLLLLPTDLLILLLYTLWMRRSTESRWGMKAAFGMQLIVLVLIALRWIPELEGLAPGFLMRPVLMVLTIFLSIQLYRISPFNTVTHQPVMDLRGILTVGLILYHLIIWIGGEASAFSHYIVIPLSYLLHIRVLYAYQGMSHREQGDRIDTLSRDIESLFNFMRTLGSAITEHIEIDRVLDYIVNSVLTNTRADGGAILLVDEFDDNLRVKAVSGIFPPPYPVPSKVKEKHSAMRDYFVTTPVPVGETIFGEVFQSGQPVFIQNAARDERFQYNRREDLQFISSLIVIPLIVSKRILGILSIVKRSPGSYFSQKDFDNIRSFADYTSLSLDNLFTYIELLEKKEMEREVGIAADIQQKLLPSRLPTIESTDVSAYSIPAKGVSGDYFDIIKLKNNRLALVMCDVAGKGVPASLVMIMIRSILHLIASAQKDAATIVSWINRGITGQIDIDHYATLSFLTFDPENMSIEYSNAGHHPLMIYRRSSDSIETLDTDGLPLGIERDSRYHSRKAKLKIGDIICLYTDGIIEAMNPDGEQYGYDRVARYISANANTGSRALCDGIRTDISAFAGKAKQHDDQTFLVMKIV